MLHSIWLYRGFILGSVMRELLSRYHRSLLGIMWALLNPLVMITVYTVVFSEIMRTRLPGMGGKYIYSIYLCAGLLTWNFFSEILSKTLTVFIDNGNLLKKVNFPKACLPAIILISESANFGIIFLIFMAMQAVIGTFPGPLLLAVFPVLVIQAALAVGLGVLLGTLNVFFRDINHIVKIGLQFWFWLTPIVYPLSIVPEYMRAVFQLNPLFPLTEAYQRVFVIHEAPRWETLVPVAIFAAFILWLGLHTFRKNAGEIVDEL